MSMTPFSLRLTQAARLMLWVFLTMTTMGPFASDTVTVELRFPEGGLKERYRCLRDSQGMEVRIGPHEEWHANGTLKGVVNWRGGVEEGDAVFYFPDGRKSYATHYRAGKKNGFATVWYPNGQKQWQAMYQDGQTNGVWREWFADGRKKFEAMYRKGRLDGHATWWHANGRIEQERDYDLGKSLADSVRAYDSSGRLTYPLPSSSMVRPQGASAMAENESH